ncbi:sperm-associated antigen 7 homolog isoform X2 [Tachysurus fulvidraco]|uniref:sperm-associated antigen 7 homolog isoform X2 n=1 Tax=Tachysurus fulvidraco TaxID=1234273 RepID=UPI001FF01B5A|nr:sperm-associated antigen 7 homolog isoform X2 [Tachysurus fulvidraco]
MADLLGSILSSMEKPPTVGDQESRRKAREQAARMKKMQEDEKRKKAEFRKKMEKDVSDFIQDSSLQKKKYDPMGKIERSILHDVAEVAGLTSFSFGEDEESRYVMLFKKEFAPSDDELEAYRRGEEWDHAKAEERRKLKVLIRRAWISLSCPLLCSGAGSVGGGSSQSEPQEAVVSQLQLQRQIQPSDWHVCC